VPAGRETLPTPYAECVQDDKALEAPQISNPLLRWMALASGVALLGLGFAGFFLPGLPGTPFLLVAAWLFSLSNPRLYRWMVTNRWFGQIVADYRAGLGIPRRIKLIAVSTVVVVVSVSVGLALEGWLRLAVGALGVVGIAFILTRPTRELVESPF
jgi:uncharacterized membrane protein YbaN (DUF454 family)